MKRLHTPDLLRQEAAAPLVPNRRASKPTDLSSDHLATAHADLLKSAKGTKFRTILADPAWQFQNRTGKMAPEHRRLNRYGTMTVDEIASLPVAQIADDVSHLYLWVPNALLPEGLHVLKAWGFEYKTNFIWYKIRKDGGPDRRGVGFYFRNVTEIVLFGVRNKPARGVAKKAARTLKAGRTQPNILATRKREHSRKPDELYDIIEACSPGPRMELFARGTRPGWTTWGDQAEDYKVTWSTYAHNSSAQRDLLAAD